MRLTLIALLLSIITGCSGQDKREHSLVGNCEGCEAVLEFGNRQLTSSDTLPGFNNEGPKLKIHGTIYIKDGETPAPEVILYVFHTNREGIYEAPEKHDKYGKLFRSPDSVRLWRTNLSR